MEPGVMLSQSQVELIRDATERILETTGVKVMHDEALSLCRKAGAKVDKTSGVVRIPRQLLRELIAQAPAEYGVTGVDGAWHTVGDNRQWGVAITTDPWIIDYDTRQPRRPRLEDIRRNTAIGQQLDHVLGMTCMDFPVSDVEGPHSNLRALQEHLLHHTKHNFIYATSVDSMNRWLKIGRILSRGDDLSGSRLFTVAVASLSPLAVTEANVEFLKVASKYDFPVASTVCPTAGMTSPFSLAGTLALGNAEVIFLLALTQIYRPGAPFVYALGPAVANMQNGACLYYTLDKVLWKAAAVQLGKSYNIPVAAECGGAMVHRFDQQSGAEGMLFMLAAVTPGAHLLCGFGSTHNAVAHSSEMMLIQDAYLRAAQFLARGIRTDAERLALEAIDRAGPSGDYMTDDLTLKYLRGGEFFSNDLFDLSGDLEASASLVERAHEKVLSMTAHFNSPVPSDMQETLCRFFHDEAAGDGEERYEGDT